MTLYTTELRPQEEISKKNQIMQFLQHREDPTTVATYQVFWRNLAVDSQTGQMHLSKVSTLSGSQVQFSQAVSMCVITSYRQETKSFQLKLRVMQRINSLQNCLNLKIFT